MRKWVRLANNNNNRKLCYKSMIKLQVQVIQSSDQKHSEVWLAFLLSLVCICYEMTINCTLIIFWIGTLSHWSAQNGWCSLSKCSELSNFAKKCFSWSHSSVLQDNIIGLAKLFEKPDSNESKQKNKMQQPEPGTQPGKAYLNQLKFFKLISNF